MNTTTRPSVSEEVKTLGHKLFDHQLTRRLKEKGPLAFAGRHESYGILAEEFNKELLDALHSNDLLDFVWESLDVAVGAFWAAVSAIQEYEDSLDDHNRGKTWEDQFNKKLGDGSS